MIHIGIGKDVHRLVEDRRLVLGGVEVPFDKGLLGHSDADVVCHAISDALLGAAALGDIGKHFPDTDAQYKDISSLLILENVRKLINTQSWEICNVDCVVVMQQPKIAPFIPEMRKNISRVLQLDPTTVSIKAATTERLGFEGAGEGISADAVVLLYKKDLS